MPLCNKTSVIMCVSVWCVEGGGGSGLSIVLLLCCRSPAQTYSGPLSLLSYGREMWADSTEFHNAQLAGFVMQAYYSFVPVGALQE